MASLSNFDQRQVFLTAQPKPGALRVCEMKLLHRAINGAKFSETYTMSLAPLSQAWAAADIINCIAAMHGLSLADMIGPRRARVYARPRQIAMYLCRQYCQHMSLPAIGRIFKRDHTTIMAGVKRVEELYQSDPDFRKQLNRCKDMLGSRKDAQKQ